VYLTAADASGVMVSMIQSNYMGFGSGVVVPGTGISLQNRGAISRRYKDIRTRSGEQACLSHDHPGLCDQRRRTGDELRVMGGPMQPQGHVQVLVRIADHGQNPQAACDGPRFRWVQGMQVSCEEGFPQSTLDELRRRGHDLLAIDDYNSFGSCQAIWRLDDGILRRVTRAATVKPRPSRSRSCLLPPADRCRFGNDFRQSN